MKFPLDKKIIISTEPLSLGLGDVLWFCPIIKKISKTFNTKIDIVTHWPEIFKNNPYIENIFNLKHFDSKNLIGSHFYFRPLFDENFFHFLIDNRQFIANRMRFSLKEEEKQIEFFPDPSPFNLLPKNYVMLHCGIRGPDRDLGQKNWQKLIDILNYKGIPVVIEGPENFSYDLNIKNGLNLRGKLSSISDTWHLINKSSCFVTFDTGMYVLAGTTDAQIFLIDSYLDSQWHKPYRNGSYDYKHTIIKGNCKEYCMGNLEYYTLPNKEGFWQRGVQKCPLNINFQCVPSAEKIAEEIVHFWNKL